MKRCANITCWTDYPFVGLGDKPGVRAPIRRVTVYHYDGNKMATVRAQCGAIEWIKAGYLYRNRARLMEGAVAISRRKLERMVSTRPLEEFEGVVVGVTADDMAVNLKPTYEDHLPEHTMDIRLSEVSVADLPLVKDGARFTLTINRRTGLRPARKQAPLRHLVFSRKVWTAEAVAKIDILASEIELPETSHA